MPVWTGAHKERALLVRRLARLGFIANPDELQARINTGYARRGRPEGHPLWFCRAVYQGVEVGLFGIQSIRKCVRKGITVQEAKGFRPYEYEVFAL